MIIKLILEHEMLRYKLYWPSLMVSLTVYKPWVTSSHCPIYH